MRECKSMAKFLDGPAGGVTLNLKRLPRWVRVVIDQSGAVDALDQLEDEVRPGEFAFVYRMKGEVQRVIACSRERGCQRMELADYEFYAEQPPQETLRSNDAWQAWATAENTKAQGESSE